MEKNSSTNQPEDEDDDEDDDEEGLWVSRPLSSENPTNDVASFSFSFLLPVQTDLWAGLNCHVTLFADCSADAARFTGKVTCWVAAGPAAVSDAPMVTPVVTPLVTPLVIPVVTPVVIPVPSPALSSLFSSSGSVKSSLSTSASVVSPNKSQPGSAGGRLDRPTSEDLLPAAKSLGSESDRSESQSLSPATEPQPSTDRSTGDVLLLPRSEPLIGWSLSEPASSWLWLDKERKTPLESDSSVRLESGELSSLAELRGCRGRGMRAPKANRRPEKRPTLQGARERICITNSNLSPFFPAILPQSIDHTLQCSNFCSFREALPTPLAPSPKSGWEGSLSEQDSGFSEKWPRRGRSPPARPPTPPSPGFSRQQELFLKHPGRLRGLPMIGRMADALLRFNSRKKKGVVVQREGGVLDGAEREIE
ncbi:hypothetical protein EYF80_027763 [Liparis tanakae]|uniref:Uncharacterized protein n=1 Tax=Liparis tanakae TaxID=230148 RepID=A0A4Z2H9U9_9TELE|nr:hypothetical protein EYF80_027763 [Liparis tanakae]